MYQRDCVRLYDAIYTRMKDYREEAEKIRHCIRAYHPAARTVLDVACGTAEHARYLKRDFELDGLDFSEDFLEVARRKNPECNYYLGDMKAFQLNRKYDVVMTLFSSIGYVCTIENVITTLRCFSRHLNPGGMILVEPWLTPEAFQPGKLHMFTVNEPDFKVSRMNITELRDGLSCFTWNFLVGDKRGVRHFTEEHRLGLFSVDQMKHAFTEAGLAVEHDEKGIFGRGLYLARHLAD